MSALQALLSGARNMWLQKLQKEGILNFRLVLLGILGIGLMLAGGFMESQDTKGKKDVSGDIQKNIPIVSNRSYEENLESKLSNILSQVKGAGTVAVSITLENNGVQEHAKNIVKESKTTQEKDTAGGVRTTTEVKESEQILMSKETGSGADRPVVVNEIKPTIKGVLVIAEGAYDSNIKANLVKAVEAGLGIPSYKVTVLTYRK